MIFYFALFPELNRTSLSQTIEPSGAQYSFENSSVNRLTTLAYSTWNCSFFSLALCPRGSIMSVYRCSFPEMNSQNRCPHSFR